MRITLGTEERQYAAGLFKRVPKWWVTCKIEFSTDELQTINAKDLGDTIVYTQQHHNQAGEEIKRTLKEVMRHGIECSFNSPGEATEFEEYVRSGNLPALKEHIEEHQQAVNRRETFEL